MILLDSDVLIGQTSLSLGVPLHTFNQRHYSFIPGMPNCLYVANTSKAMSQSAEESQTTP